MPTYPKLTLI